MPQVFAIEGLDRLGKSTLIEGIQEKLGFYQVVHFGKPKRLKLYESARTEFAGCGIPEENLTLYLYQEESFRNSMIMARSGARLIYDRWHLGEAVYSPLYRGYEGDYVFSLEKSTRVNECADIRLILLVEDFDRSTHFKSDGDSFDDSKRREEQALFVQAFKRSAIQDKRIICVTALDGGFKSKSTIVMEATS